jgi:hypothetical protein
MPSRFANRPSSRRFLSTEELRSRHGLSQAWGNTELFSDGQWQVIRVVLEAQGWNHYQIELIHDQLRQGWSLAMAKQNVAMMTGQCPLRAQPLS